MTNGQIKIASIISKRDGIPITEAMQIVRDCLIQIDYSLTQGNYDEVEEVINGDLGLELDYVYDLLMF